MISICVPTRGRPERLRTMISSAISTAQSPNDLEFLVYRDDDDLSMEKFEFKQTTVLTGPRSSVSKMTNICFANSRGDLIMYAADDIIFRTPGWDKLIQECRNSRPKAAFLVYGNDLSLNAKSIATHGFVSREFANINGFLLTEKFEADFCDTWNTQIARLSRSLIYLPSMVIEHMHPSWGKSTVDSTYLDRKSHQNYLRFWFRFNLLFPMRLNSIFRIKLHNFSLKYAK